MTGPGKGGEQEEVAGSIVSFCHNDSSQDLGKRKGCWHGLSGYRDEQGNMFPETASQDADQTSSDASVPPTGAHIFAH
ncbi:hypothetical protein ARMGADRAFT_1089813 [Armillaria gallica]|uniref:Uncharacterized protein n=1 Tax=Armillaria gallica TaxID=47427 RepID=A0A2H3CIZ7_ARMGA|nr:hypothetical protein ARMGADRAFT_1089813 [Armillaria gallica]